MKNKGGLMILAIEILLTYTKLEKESDVEVEYCILVSNYARLGTPLEEHGKFVLL